MWRLVILLILLVVVYFMVRGALRGLLAKSKDRARAELSGQSAEMVQDPVCGMFVPKEGALFIRNADRTYFFCGDSCRNTYEKKLSSV
jgi:YHS domain-containing protein